VISAALIGVLAGVVAGLLGVGGGVLFVPALVLLLGLTQHEAEATSLLAIVPVALVGAWRQSRYGNLDLRAGLLLGALAVPGAFAGVALANVLPEHVLRRGFAVLLVVIAGQMAWRARRPTRRSTAAAAPPRSAAPPGSPRRRA
jgi:uncharacterized membrane protein YfcA